MAKRYKDETRYIVALPLVAMSIDLFLVNVRRIYLVIKLGRFVIK